MRSYKKAKRTNKDRDWKRYRRLKKQAQTTCRQAYNKYINDVICSEPGASRRLGAFIKANRCDQTGVAPLKEGNLLHSDPKAKADVLNRQFASVFTSYYTSDLLDLGPSPYPPMNEIIINNQGIVKLLKNLNPHKGGYRTGWHSRKTTEGNCCRNCTSQYPLVLGFTQPRYCTVSMEESIGFPHFQEGQQIITSQLQAYLSDCHSIQAV